MEPVKPQDKGQLSHMTNHRLHVECTRVPNVSSSVYRIYKNVKTDQLLLQGGVMYLRTQSLLLNNSLLCSNSQNIQELIYQAILQVIYINQPQFGLIIFIYLYTQPNYWYLQVLNTSPYNTITTLVIIETEKTLSQLRCH